MKRINVQNMKSSNGNDVPNQFIIKDNNNNKMYFQSYDVIVAIIGENEKTSLDEKYWKYSKTTIKYRNQFLGEDSSTIEKKVKDGIYKLENLN